MRALLALALSALAAPLGAQTVVPLEEALVLARQQTIAVLRADAGVRAARVTTEAVADRRWPSLQLAAGGGQRYGLSLDQTIGGLTQETVESVDLGLSASYVVFDGFERRAEARSAEAGLRAAELDRARAEQVAAVAVLEGYLAVAQASADRRVAVETLGAQRALLAEVEVQVEMGERPASETAQQHERVATARGAVLDAERDRDLAAARLVRTLGLDPAADYAFPTPDALPSADVPAGDLVQRALDRRVDLRAAAVAVEAAEADGRAARARRLPEVSVGGSLGTTYTSAGASGLPGQLQNNRAGALRVSVSLPLLDRGVTRQRVRQAEARAVLLRAEAEDARRAVALEVDERRIQIDALRARAEVAAVRVAAAQTALDAERARYAAGETTLQAVTLLQARAVEARTEQEQLAVAARFQALLLNVAVGEVR